KDYSGLPPQNTYYDLLGREIWMEHSGFDGRTVCVEKVYDEFGNVTHESLPRIVGAAQLWTVSEYDLLNRLIRITPPDGHSVSTTYNGRVVSSQDQMGNVVTKRYGTRNDLETVSDATGTVAYEYDAIGKLIKLTDQQGNETTITYNIHGNKTSISDPDSGTNYFGYNGFGELTHEFRPDGSVVTLDYDSLGRIIQRESPDGREDWLYDSRVGALGKLLRVRHIGEFEEKYYYDSLGRLSSTSTVVGSDAARKVKYSYDSLGRLYKKYFPSGFTLLYRYNSFGYLSRIYDTNNTATPLWSVSAMDAANRVSRANLGNGLTNKYYFNSQTGALKEVRAQSCDGGVCANEYRMKFEYDPIGNLTRRVDTVRNLDESFRYDSAYRLTSTQVRGLEKYVVQYDDLGNIT
ncbi:MAG: RHS repeat protein, partial [Bdellovibrionales bacterium]|nr:RHS repeat protein [Bdellovibrionales bacterium]